MKNIVFEALAEAARLAEPVTLGVKRDFTIASGSSRREEAQIEIRNPKSQIRVDQSLLASAATEDGWLYREVVTPPSALWIAGAGHIAQAVAPLALQLDFNVT